MPMNLARSVQKFLASRRQFVTYCLVGIAGVALDFGVYCLLVRVLGVEHYQIANAGGYGVAVVFSFTANSRLTFSVTDRVAWRFAIFCGVAFAGWATSAWLLSLLVEEQGLGVVTSKLLTLIAVLFIQYNLNRLFTFGEKSHDSQI